VRYREMVADEAEAVLALAMRGFDELVRPDFSDDGVAEFRKAARAFVVDRPAGHLITVAERDGHIAGMVDVRDGSHICLFFVEREQRGRGIGRALLASALACGAGDKAPPAAVTVNSSPWAVPVYERLGFRATGPQIEHNGMRAIPMTKPLSQPAATCAAGISWTA
jgi:GNAT superfamily N-acetyltransferase